MMAFWQKKMQMTYCATSIRPHLSIVILGAANCLPACHSSSAPVSLCICSILTPFGQQRHPPANQHCHLEDHEPEPQQWELNPQEQV